MTRPRDIGTRSETAVVRYLVANGYPHAERRSLRGALDAGDITGCPGICFEVKGGEAAKVASDLTIAGWMAELATETVNAKADVGLLVVQRRGVGPSNAGRWWAYMPAFQFAGLMALSHVDRRVTFPVRMLLADAVTLLRAAGYGSEPRPTDAELDDCAFCCASPRRPADCPIHGQPEPRPAVAPYLPNAAAPEGIEDVALPGLEVA